MGIQEILQLAASIGSFQPLVKQAMEGVSQCLLEVKNPAEKLIDWTTQQRIKALKAYMDAGIPGEHAVALLLDDMNRLRSIVNARK
jgi:hypothetical protein